MNNSNNNNYAKKLKSDQEVNRHHEVFNLMKLTQKEEFERIETALKQSFKYVIKSSEKLNDELYNHYSTPEDDKTCFQICFEDIFNPKYERQDFQHILLKYCQKKYKMNPSYEEEKPAENLYEVVFKIGEDKIMKYEIKCLDKKSVKKAISLEIIKELFPGIFKWILIGNVKKVDAILKTNAFDKSILSDDRSGNDFYNKIYDELEDVKIFKSEIYKKKLKKNIPENYISENHAKKLKDLHFTTIITKTHQDLNKECLKFDHPSTENETKKRCYSVTVSGGITPLFKIEVESKNKTFAKNAAALKYIQYYAFPTFQLIYKRLIGEECEISEEMEEILDFQNKEVEKIENDEKEEMKEDSDKSNLDSSAESINPENEEENDEVENEKSPSTVEDFHGVDNKEDSDDDDNSTVKTQPQSESDETLVKTQSKYEEDASFIGQDDSIDVSINDRRRVIEQHSFYLEKEKNNNRVNKSFNNPKKISNFKDIDEENSNLDNTFVSEDSELSQNEEEFNSGEQENPLFPKSDNNNRKNINVFDELNESHDDILSVVKELSNEGTSQSKSTISSKASTFNKKSTPVKVDSNVPSKSESRAKSSNPFDEDSESSSDSDKEEEKEEVKKKKVEKVDASCQTEDMKSKLIENLLEIYNKNFEKLISEFYGFELIDYKIGDIEEKKKFKSIYEKINQDFIDLDVNLFNIENEDILINLDAALKKYKEVSKLNIKLKDSKEETKILILKGKATNKKLGGKNKFEITLTGKIPNTTKKMIEDSKKIGAIFTIKFLFPALYQKVIAGSMTGLLIKKREIFSSNTSMIMNNTQSTIHLEDSFFKNNLNTTLAGAKITQSMNENNESIKEKKNEKKHKSYEMSEKTISNMEMDLDSESNDDYLRNKKLDFSKNKEAAEVSVTTTSVKSLATRLSGNKLKRISHEKCKKKFKYLNKILECDIEEIVYNEKKFGKYKVKNFDSVRKKAEFIGQLNNNILNQNYTSLLNLIMQKTHKISLNFISEDFTNILFKIEGEKLVGIKVKFQNKKEANKIGSLVIVRLLMRFVYEKMEKGEELEVKEDVF